MKLIFEFHKTALIIAIERDNLEIMEALLTDEKIDVNIKGILIHFVFIKFELIFLNHISNQIIQLHSKSFFIL